MYRMDLTRLVSAPSSENAEEGQGLVEYALILFLVAVVVIAILIVLGPQIGSVFSTVTKTLASCAHPNPMGQCPPGQQ